MYVGRLVKEKIPDYVAVNGHSYLVTEIGEDLLKNNGNVTKVTCFRVVHPRVINSRKERMGCMEIGTLETA